MPAWQHYDEPGHFEFAWLIANHSGRVEPGTYDQAMRREMAASMIEHGFFRNLNYRPNLLSTDEPIWIGISQITNRPLYYFLVALPLHVIPFTDITFQLYVTRLVSLGMYLVVLVASYGIVVELTPEGHPLRWILPLTLALLPAFADLMTAVNDDVGATAFFSLFLWASVRMIRRGFSLPRLMAVLFSCLACYWTKSTVAFSLLLLPIPIFLSMPGKVRRRAWPVLAFLVISALFFIFDWSDPAHWLVLRTQTAPARIRSQSAPFGEYIFQLNGDSGFSQPQVIQILSPDNVKILRGHRVTLGAWIWGDQAGTASTPVLMDGEKLKSKEVPVTESPTFFSLTMRIDQHAGAVQIQLVPLLDGNNPDAKIYYDGITLVSGDFSEYSDAPIFNDQSISTGTWDGKSIHNVIQNPSAEQAWPGLQPRLDTFLMANTPIPPSMILSSLLDWSSTRSYFQVAATFLFTSFWGRFGWGNIRILGENTFELAALGTALGLIGAGLLIWRKRKEIQWGLIILFGASLISVWGAALLRGIPAIIGADNYIPRARYAFPVIIPTMLILCAGWYEIIRLLNIRFHLNLKWGWIFYVSGLLLLDLLAIASIYRFYKIG